MTTKKHIAHQVPVCTLSKYHLHLRIILPNDSLIPSPNSQPPNPHPQLTSRPPRRVRQEHEQLRRRHGPLAGRGAGGRASTFAAVLRKFPGAGTSRRA